VALSQNDRKIVVKIFCKSGAGLVFTRRFGAAAGFSNRSESDADTLLFRFETARKETTVGGKNNARGLARGTRCRSVAYIGTVIGAKTKSNSARDCADESTETLR